MFDWSENTYERVLEVVAESIAKYIFVYLEDNGVDEWDYLQLLRGDWPLIRVIANSLGMFVCR